MEGRFDNTIAFSPLQDEQVTDRGLDYVNGLYDSMMDIFDNEIAPVINYNLELALKGDYNGRDVVEAMMEELVMKDMGHDVLHDYLSLYNTLLRAVEAYSKQCELNRLFDENGFELRLLYLYWYPYYTRNHRRGPRPYFRAKSMIETLSVSFVIANEVMCLCRYASNVWSALEYAYIGSKRLQFTWADFFNYLYATHSSVATTMVYNVISMMLKGKQIPSGVCKLNPLEKEGASLAKCAYEDGWNPNSEIVGLESTFGIRAVRFDYNQKHCLSFAGTRIDFSSLRRSIVSVQNILTDIIQIAYKPTPAYLAAVGVVDTMLENNKDLQVFGHSLGGGLMQFACAANSCTRVAGYGYNSAGLSAATCDILTKHGTYVPLKNIVHVNASTDVVSKIGTFLGERKEVDTTGVNMLDAHKIDNLIQVISQL